MENASKALIIAGAILISIVLISLGVMILGQGSNLVKNADMSGAEISTYNSEWEAYVGGNVRGTVVKQMLAKVRQHNKTNTDVSKKIGVTLWAADKTTQKASGETDFTKAPTVIADSKVNDGYSYTVTASYGSGNLLNEIVVKKN